MKSNIILQGDALTKLKELESESINCCMTSPPYWALRDYGVSGQLGLEPTFQEYINKLCDIFDEVKRVLRKDGTLWINIGDSYFGGGRGSDAKLRGAIKGEPTYESNNSAKPDWDLMDMKSKSLCNIPARFSIEMQNRGWILRNVIIWHKPNCMPSSVKDRFTVDFEYLYFFVKSKKYFFETQYEPYSQATKNDSRFNPGSKSHHTYDGKTEHPPEGIIIKPQKGGFKQGALEGRNKRCVWLVKTKPFKEAHFATYPESLCKTPIKAGCPEFVCNKCGEARNPIYKSQFKQHSVGATSGQYWEVRNFKGDNTVINSTIQIGLSDCGCNAGFSGGIVLDPFFGAGTTGLVALKQNKKFIGIELNPEYIKIAEKRLKPFLEQEKL